MVSHPLAIVLVLAWMPATAIAAGRPIVVELFTSEGCSSCPPAESNIVRSIPTVGQWTGAALVLTAEAPEGQDAAALLEAPDGRIIGAARLGS